MLGRSRAVLPPSEEGGGFRRRRKTEGEINLFSFAGVVLKEISFSPSVNRSLQSRLPAPSQREPSRAVKIALTGRPRRTLNNIMPITLRPRRFSGKRARGGRAVVPRVRARAFVPFYRRPSENGRRLI